jgi:hypothetical protein
LLQASDAIGPSIYSCHELAHYLSQDFLSQGRDFAGIARPFSIRISAVLALSPHFILCGSAALGLTAPYWANAMLLGISLNIVPLIQRRCILAAYRKSQRFLAAVLPAPLGRGVQELQFAARAPDCSLDGRFLVLFP